MLIINHLLKVLYLASVKLVKPKNQLLGFLYPVGTDNSFNPLFCCAFFYFRRHFAQQMVHHGRWAQENINMVNQCQNFNSFQSTEYADLPYTCWLVCSWNCVYWPLSGST